MKTTVDPAARGVLAAAGVGWRAGRCLLVDGVTLSLEPGRFVGLVGPNGAGKSTLIRLLAGLITPSAGKVYLEGRDLGRLDPEQRARAVARVPQSPPRSLDFTALEVALMGRYAHSPGWRDREEDRAAAREALAAAGAGHLADRVFCTLSGGEQQRVIIARALAQDTRVLLLDEPTANLDLRYQLEVMDTVRRLAHTRRLAVLAAIHDLSLAARFADELLLLHQGRLVAAGSPDQVLHPGVLRRVFGVEVLVERHPRSGRLLVTAEAVAPAGEL